ncbi:MAG TPA: XdhC family protein [Flavobacterium sp.]|nr:XdhC family protein [Flavobacterium sp.]
MIAAFYQKTREWLALENRLVLMVVIANEGSSPGRKGFKMFVSKNDMLGTIGGGIMEHKLVEYARILLEKPNFSPFVKHQIHDKSATKDQSGMICSGQQTVAFFDLDSDFLTAIEMILADPETKVTYSNLGINAPENPQTEWFFQESNAVIPKAYIIGGGHVGLALSEVLSLLDFEIHILDHRENLNTMEANHFARTKQVVDFAAIDQYIPEGDDRYVIIMSFGYRTDDVIIRRLLGRKFKYIGMLGSKEKIATLFKNLIGDGFAQADLDKVFAPIGLDIKSETAHEIAISVAAQLIQIKNKP